jgi:hypothetical protein
MCERYVLFIKIRLNTLFVFLNYAHLAHILREDKVLYFSFNLLSQKNVYYTVTEHMLYYHVEKSALRIAKRVHYFLIYQITVTYS